MKIESLVCCGAVCVLSACAASTSSSDTTMDSPPLLNVTSPNQVYQTVNSTAAATSQGANFHVDFRNSDVEVETAIGTFRHDTGAIDITYAGRQFVDNDGTDANGVFSDGVVSLDPGFTQDFSFTYSEVTVATSAQTGFGRAGFLTNIADIPSGGNAVFVGPAQAFFTAGGGGFEDGGVALSTVNADFGAGTVDVEISNINLPGRFDTIDVSDMIIAGSVFAGGTVTTSLNGAPVTPVGPSPSTSAAGGFFGFDTGQNGPDEVGGAIVIDGGADFIDAYFIGD